MKTIKALITVNKEQLNKLGEALTLFTFVSSMIIIYIIFG